MEDLSGELKIRNTQTQSALADAITTVMIFLKLNELDTRA